ncbi:hypothetical protein AMC82_PD00962 (plasmid) [Rhizobium phaseoli]|uniref:hypothetical protein n=1 Tax=Rhizobium phaseoli TaxID=396 RepID=UPI0007EB50DB|nr:hypothetical protein [Rhizobium phaseoli]ANL69924.1 hypothetical protein AMC84_PD00966 [Rhizobium phaseoli]ANL76361.1 hypothetical protein AMC83_PE00953 [Rhizobium phaseoli]ANL82716.1 hypothetical protein AMC82_PD00962 [Rhizobium phaseoli]
MKFLIDECLHTSLVAVAQAHGHEIEPIKNLELQENFDWQQLAPIEGERQTIEGFCDLIPGRS